MSALKGFMVAYTQPNDELWQFFKCQAEDGDHAEEQCVNAYPDCDVVGIYVASTVYAQQSERLKELQTCPNCGLEFTGFEAETP